MPLVPRLAAIGASEEHGMLRILGRGVHVRHIAAHSLHEDEPCAVAVGHHTGVAVAKVLAALHHRVDGAPCASAIIAASHEDVESIGAP